MSQSLVAIKNALPREAKKKGDTTFDRIFKYYFEKKKSIKLTDKEEAIRNRWYFAWQLLCNAYTRNQVALALKKKFELKSEKTGFNDVDSAMRLFSDPKNGDKQAKKAISEELILKGIKKAWDTENLDAYERLITRFNKVNGLENEENPIGDWMKRQKPIAIVFSSDENVLKKQADDLMRGIEDITFEDVTE